MTKPIWYFSVMGSNRGDQAIREGVKYNLRKVTDAPFAFFSCKTDLLDRRRIEQLNREGSMLLVAGSGLYSNYPLESGFYFRCSPEDFERIEVPVVLFSIGANNHIEMDRFKTLNENTAKNIKALNDVAIHTSTRDFRTLETLRRLGVEKAQFVPDPAMFCPSASLTWRHKETRPLVGLSMAQHATMLRHHRPKLIKLFGELCTYLNAIGYATVFIAHDALEHNIYEDLKSHCPCLLYYTEDSPREMMALYERCAFTVGVRCHSNIMSFGANTPFVCLAYDQKQIEFCKIVGVDPLFIGNDLTLEQVLERTNEIYGNYWAITSNMALIINDLRRKFETAINEIGELIA